MLHDGILIRRRSFYACYQSTRTRVASSNQEGHSLNVRLKDVPVQKSLDLIVQTKNL
jgi:hypothetical protein